MTHAHFNFVCPVWKKKKNPKPQFKKILAEKWEGKKNLPICYICSSPLSGTLEMYNFAFLTGLRKIYSWFRRFFTMSPCLYSLPHASDQLIPSMWMNPFWFRHTRTFLRWLTFFPHLPPVADLDFFRFSHCRSTMSSAHFIIHIHSCLISSVNYPSKQEGA